VLYETANSTRVSVLNIDFDSGKYAFIGSSYRIFKHSTGLGNTPTFVDDLSRLSEDIISVKTENALLGDKIHLFKLNKALSTIEFERTIAIPDYCRWFSKVGGKIVFARFSTEVRIDRCYLDNFMMIEEEDALTELENAGKCLQSRSPLNDCMIVSCLGFGLIKTI
jgi:hypothetical protein